MCSKNKILSKKIKIFMTKEKKAFYKITEFNANFRNDTNYTISKVGLQTYEKAIVDVDICDQRIYGIDIFSPDKANRVLLLSIWDGVSFNEIQIGSSVVNMKNTRLIGTIDIPAYSGILVKYDSISLAKTPEFATYFNRKDEMGKSYMSIPMGYSLLVALAPAIENNNGNANRYISTNGWRSINGEFISEHKHFTVLVTGDKFVDILPTIPDLPTGGTASGGTASGGTASGGTASGGTASGGTASGGTASGGTASGGTASVGTGTDIPSDGITE
jgi:hypothetical protein